MCKPLPEQGDGRNESMQGGNLFARREAPSAGGVVVVHAPAALEHSGCRPRDGELFRRRAKPSESLVEARHGDNVQISSFDVGIGATDSSNHLVAGFCRHFS